MISKNEKLAIALGSIVLASIYWSPAFFSLQSTGFGDWQFFHHMWEAGYVALARFGEWPLWDPFHCGGITIFGNPESQHLAPLFFLSFLVGPTLATKIFVWVHAVAGISGMYLLARRAYDLSRSSSTLASIAWAMSGFFSWHGSGGHITFQPFYLTPWIIMAWRTSARDLRFSAAVAGLLTWVLLEGGVYPFPFIVLLLAFDALVRLTKPGQRNRIVIAGFVSALLTALMGAVRLLPIVEELRRNPRHTVADDSATISEIIEMLTARSHAWEYGYHEYVWPEYGAFVGWGVVALAALGIVSVWKTRYRHWVIGLVFFGFLVAGYQGAYSPWPLLHRLPPYDSLRVNSRFMVFVTFYLALLSALGLRRMTDWLDRPNMIRLKQTAPWLIVLAVTIDIFAVTLPINNRWKRDPIEQVTKPAERYYMTDEHPYGRWYASFPRMGIGTERCYEAMNITVASGLWSGDQPQARIAGTSGIVHDWGRTTSTAWAEVTLNGDGRVIFNQNHAPGWRSSVGRVVQDNGRIAVDVRKGRHRIELDYLPPTFKTSIATSLFGLLAAFSLPFLLRSRTAKRSTAKQRD
ncbi:MAG: hypothetical protein JXA30_17070 [Deltaproteobacteria bacterium]|nr:hypothetical protein [Deltaproteobacteria bacterium]